MKSDATGFVFYLALALAAGLLLLRIFRSGKKGGAALVLDVLYLCLYCFLGGIVIFYVMAFVNQSDWLWGVAFCVMFWGGFFLRALPLFRHLKEREPEAKEGA
jgi:undecaprenyl pyrophosphate phosphatase UppP